MKLYDQHVHSGFSFDSEQDPREYLVAAEKLGLEYFVLTDHCDLNYFDRGSDLFFDLKEQDKCLSELQKEFPSIKILRGIEIGYKPSELKRIKQIIKDNRFDVINFSLHESDNIDYYEKTDYQRAGIMNALDIYFKRELEMAKSFDDYDVFCHLDYGFKTAYKMDKSLKISLFEDILSQIMKEVIKREKALEINIKVQGEINLEHTRYILNLYKSLGGKYLTLSSDAHSVNRFCDSFDKYTKVIKEEGFDELVYFLERKKHFLKI